MTDLVMNKTRHCPYCPVAAGDDNFMWQHISDHLENQTKYPQFKPVPLPVPVQHVPRNGVAVGNQVPMNNRGGKQGGDLTKEKNNEDISTEKLLTEELSNDGGVGNKVSTDELSNKDLGDEELSTEKLLSNYLNAKELTTEELLNKDLIGEEVTSDKLGKEGDGTKEEISDAHLLNNDLKGRELSDEELLNLHVNDEEISNEDLLNNDLSDGGKDLEESVVDSIKNDFGQNSIPCGESSSNEAETEPILTNPAVPNDTEDRSSKRKGKKPRKSAPKHIDEVLNNPDTNDDNKGSNFDTLKKEVEDPTTSEVEAETEIKKEANVEANKIVEGKQKIMIKGKRKVEKRVKNGSEIEMKPKIEVEGKGDQDIDAKKNVKGKPKLEAKVKKNVETEVKKNVELKHEVEMEPDASRNESERKPSLKENPSVAIKLEYLSNPTPDQIKKCISPKYKCPVCSEVHQDFGGHVSLSHGLVRCGRDRACNLFFETMEDRRNHEECVHGTANTPTMWKIICGHCKDVKFPDLYTVVEHRHSLHSFHTCTLCSMITTKDEYYQVHMKSHTIRNPNIFNLKNGKSLLENLLTYPIATLNQGRSLATCNLCSPGLQAQFDVSEGGEKLWEHFKTGHKVKNPAEALLRLFNGKQFHFRTLLNDEKRLLQLEAAAREEEEAAAKQAEAIAQKQREAAAKKLEAAEKEREAIAARKREADAKEREAVAKKMEAAIKEKEAAAARKREAEAKQREEAAKKAEVAANKGAAKKKEVDAKQRETANKKSEAKVDDQSDPLEVMKNVVLGSSVSIKLKSKAQIKPAQIKKIGTNESANLSTPKASLVEIKPDPEPAEVVAVKVVENKRKRKRTVTKKISSDTQANLSNSPVNVKKELVAEDSQEIKIEVVGGLEEASSDTRSIEASIPTIFIKPGSPYTCEVCNAKFTDNGDHLCFQHGMVKCASAKNCQGFFGSSFEKEKHEKESHVDTFSCMPCKMKFNNVYSQLEHRNSGHSQLTCMFCFVGFKCQEKEFSYFKSHMKTHKIGQSLLNDNDERSLFEKLLGDPIVDFNRETMSVSCNLCFKAQTSSGVMSVKEGGNQLWEHFKVIHKIKSSSEMLHLFNGTGFSFSNRKLKYSAKLETFVHKESKSSAVKANESVVKHEISEPKRNMTETSIVKENASKKKRGRPSKVGHEKDEEIPLMQLQPGKVKDELVRDQGLDDLYGNPLAKKNRNNSKVQANEMVKDQDPLGNVENVKKEEIAYEGEVKKEVPLELFPQEQVMAAIDDLQENTKPKKKRQRRTKAQIEEDLKKESDKKQKGRKAKDVSIQQADEDVSLNQSQPLEMMDDLEANEDLMLQISKLPATKKAYEENTNADDTEAIDEQTHNTNDEDADHNASNTNYDIATDGQHDEDIDNYAHEKDVLKTDVHDSEAHNDDDPDDIEAIEEPPQITDDAHEDLGKDTDEADEELDYSTNDAEEVEAAVGDNTNDEEESVPNNDADEEPSYNTNEADDEQADNSVEAGGESEEPVEDKEADGMEGADEEQTDGNAGEEQADSNADVGNEDAEEDEGMEDADNERMEEAEDEGMEEADNKGMEEADNEVEGMEDTEDEGMEDDDEEQADSSAVKGDEIPTLTYSDSLEY